MKLCEQILLYASNELPPKEHAQMAEHVRDCAVCRQQLAVWRGAERAAVPAAAPAEMIERLFAKTTRKKSFFARWKMAVAATCAVLALAVCLVEMQVKHEQNEEAIYAYVSENLEDEYTSFADDLDEFELYF